MGYFTSVSVFPTIIVDKFQCGKDFDGVMRIMAKRKVDKNKEQTKNYYFNLLKHVKQSISLDEGRLNCSK